MFYTNHPAMMMLVFSLVVMATMMVEPVHGVDKGVQVRITKKAMEYALDVELGKLKEETRKKSFDQSGSDGRLTWGASNTRVRTIDFPSKTLHPVSNHGIRVSIYNAHIQITGRVHYRYKRKWFSFSDSIGVTISARRIRFDLTFAFGHTTKGLPTVFTTGCSSDMNVDVDFHGGKAWIYNLFSGVLERKLRSSLQRSLCRSAEKAINVDIKKKLETFKTKSSINDWAEIDYSLTADPVYKDKYMDIFLKGEIISKDGRRSSGIPFTNFATPASATKMIYIWLSEYTFNTAAQVAHAAGEFDTTVNAWDKSDPDKTRDKLNTKFLKIFAPQLYSKYPDMSIGMHITSYRAPFIRISPEGIRLFIFVRSLFKVRDVKQNKSTEVFGINFDIHASISATVTNGRIIPKLVPGFKFQADVDKPFNDLILVNLLNSRFVYGMLYRIIMIRVNPLLAKGVELPEMKDVNPQSFDIQLQNGAVQLGADIGV